MSTNLRFERVSTKPASFTAGTVYFEDASNLIYVGTGSGANDYVVYSGVRDVNWNQSTAELSFVKPNGTTITLDFDNLVGYDDFDNLVAGIGLQKIKEQDDSSSYRFSATGIANTEYLKTADSSTVIGALKTLDAQLKTVTDNSGVISLGGAKGVLNLKGDNTDTGTINLTMTASADSSVLSASIVDTNSAAYKTVDFFVGITGSTDASTDDTIKGAKKYTAEVLGTDTDTSAKTTVYGVQAFAKDNLGKPGDTSAAITIYGARQKAADVKTELLGDAATDSSVSKTIEGLIKKIDDTSTNTTLHLYSGDGTTPASNITADGQTYILKQGTATVATFNIEKDSFVTDGSVANFDTSTSEHGIGWYIVLALRTTDTSTGTSTEKTIYIPAESLVDAYTADNPDTSNIVLTINQENNTISASVPKSDGTHLVQHNNSEVTLATIAGQTVNAKIASLENTADNTAGGVKITETVTSGDAELSARIVDGAVTTAKIANGNVTEAKLSSDVSTKLNSAVQTVTGETAISNPTDDYINVKVSAAKTDTNVALSTTYSLTTHDVSTATSSSTGVATAYDVQDYVKKYVAEQLVWASWPA